MAERQYGGCTTDELGELVGQLHGLMSAAHREMLAVVAAFDSADGWRQDGARSVADWLVGMMGVARATADSWAEAARALESLPAVASAYADGVLSWDKVAAISGVAAWVDDEATADEAAGLSAAAVRARCRRLKPPSTPDASEEHRRRCLRLRWQDDTLRIWGRLPGDQGELVAQAIERIADQAPPDPLTGLFEPYQARCADALAQLASASLGADADPDRACVVVHAPVEALKGIGSAAETESGAVLASETLRRLACDARLELVGEGADGRAVSIGRASRNVPGWMSRRLRRRDAGCRFPGCAHHRWVHAHHIRNWADGGPTDLSNLLSLCPRHHRLLHEDGWSTRGDPEGRITFVRPDGRPLPHAPPRLRDDVRQRVLAHAG